MCDLLLQLKAKLAKLRTQLQEPAGKVGGCASQPSMFVLHAVDVHPRC